MIRFGPSGNSESFYQQGYKSSVQMPAWLNRMGLNAYEYQCSKGVNVSEATAGSIGEEAAKNGIFLSIHAPYYINMASGEEEKRINSKRYIMETLTCAKWMGAKRIVVHTGSYSKVDKKWALDTAKKVMREVLEETREKGLDDIIICPEVLGKKNQLGSLEEIIEICKIDERLLPTVDFGHIHARGLGALNSTEDFLAVLNKIEKELGYNRLKYLHCHFSRIEYTKGGEKKHWTMDDVQFGPEFEYLAQALYIKRMEPVVICESRDNMAEDALKMKKIYQSVVEGIEVEKNIDN